MKSFPFSLTGQRGAVTAPIDQPINIGVELLPEGYSLTQALYFAIKFEKTDDLREVTLPKMADLTARLQMTPATTPDRRVLKAGFGDLIAFRDQPEIQKLLQDPVAKAKIERAVYDASHKQIKTGAVTVLKDGVRVPVDAPRPVLGAPKTGDSEWPTTVQTEPGQNAPAPAPQASNIAEIDTHMLEAVSKLEAYLQNGADKLPAIYSNIPAKTWEHLVRTTTKTIRINRAKGGTIHHVPALAYTPEGMAPVVLPDFWIDETQPNGSLFVRNIRGLKFATETTDARKAREAAIEQARVIRQREAEATMKPTTLAADEDPFAGKKGAAPLMSTPATTTLGPITGTLNPVQTAETSSESSDEILARIIGPFMDAVKTAYKPANPSATDSNAGDEMIDLIQPMDQRYLAYAFNDLLNKRTGKAYQGRAAGAPVYKFTSADGRDIILPRTQIEFAILEDMRNALKDLPSLSKADAAHKIIADKDQLDFVDKTSSGILSAATPTVAPAIEDAAQPVAEAVVTNDEVAPAEMPEPTDAPSIDFSIIHAATARAATTEIPSIDLAISVKNSHADAPIIDTAALHKQSLPPSADDLDVITRRIADIVAESNTSGQPASTLIDGFAELGEDFDLAILIPQFESLHREQKNVPTFVWRRYVLGCLDAIQRAKDTGHPNIISLPSLAYGADEFGNPSEFNDYLGSRSIVADSPADEKLFNTLTELAADFHESDNEANYRRLAERRGEALELNVIDNEAPAVAIDLVAAPVSANDQVVAFFKQHYNVPGVTDAGWNQWVYTWKEGIGRGLKAEEIVGDDVADYARDFKYNISPLMDGKIYIPGVQLDPNKALDAARLEQVKPLLEQIDRGSEPHADQFARIKNENTASIYEIRPIDAINDSGNVLISIAPVLKKQLSNAFNFAANAGKASIGFVKAVCGQGEAQDVANARQRAKEALASGVAGMSLKAAFIAAGASGAGLAAVAVAGTIGTLKILHSAAHDQDIRTAINDNDYKLAGQLLVKNHGKSFAFMAGGTTIGAVMPFASEYIADSARKAGRFLSSLWPDAAKPSIKVPVVVPKVDAAAEAARRAQEAAAAALREAQDNALEAIRAEQAQQAVLDHQSADVAQTAEKARLARIAAAQRELGPGNDFRGAAFEKSAYEQPGFKDKPIEIKTIRDTFSSAENMQMPENVQPEKTIMAAAGEIRGSDLVRENGQLNEMRGSDLLRHYAM